MNASLAEHDVSLLCRHKILQGAHICFGDKMMHICRLASNKTDHTGYDQQHSTAQHITSQHSTAQHSTAQHSTLQHSTAHMLCVQHVLLRQTTSACSSKDPLTRNSTRGQAKHACASSTLSLRLLSCSGVRLRNFALAAYSAVRPAIALSSLDPLSFPDACASKVPIAQIHDFSTRVSLKLLWGSHDISTRNPLELLSSKPGMTGFPRQEQSEAQGCGETTICGKEKTL